MLSKQNPTLIFFILITTILLIYLIYENYYKNINEGLIGYGGLPLFNFGTREFAPTRLMSYDVRGDIPVGFYPVSIFNEPEFPSRRRYFYTNYNSPGFYTPSYYNPWLGVAPSMYNSTFSVPYKADNNSNSNNNVKPILDNPN